MVIFWSKFMNKLEYLISSSELIWIYDEMWKLRREKKSQIFMSFDGI